MDELFGVDLAPELHLVQQEDKPRKVEVEVRPKEVAV
jgi:hypothetical protein